MKEELDRIMAAYDSLHNEYLNELRLHAAAREKALVEERKVGQLTDFLKDVCDIVESVMEDGLSETEGMLKLYNLIQEPRFS